MTILLNRIAALAAAATFASPALAQDEGRQPLLHQAQGEGAATDAQRELETADIYAFLEESLKN